jgi:adenylate cyclase class 2
MEEFEVKFLGVDPQAIESRLVELGGTKMFDRMFHRAVFDYADLRLDKRAAWVRVRDEGDRTTMSFKQRLGWNADDPHSNDTGMIEEEVVVSDFETACKILRHIGLTDKFFMENRRVQYKLDGAEVDIEYWPMLEPYLEIEAGSWEEVDKTIEKLSLNPADKKLFSTTQIYAQVGIDDKDYQILTFDKLVKKAPSAGAQ